MVASKVLVVSTAVLVAILGCPDSARAGGAEQQTMARAKKHVSAAMQMQEMQEALAEQTKAIQALQQQLQSRDQVIDQLQQGVDTLQVTFTATQQKDEQTAKTLENDVADLKTVTASTANSFQENQKQIADFEHPTQLRFKGITITPGGFLEAAGIYRRHNENGDVGSTYGNIPFSRTANASLSEFRGSARQSRISLSAIWSGPFPSIANLVRCS